MTRDILKLAPVLLLLTWLAAYALLYGDNHIGRDAAPFALAIAAGDGRGDRVALDALRGHVVVLDFWASWCEPCRRSTPILNRIATDYADRGVRVYGLNQEPIAAIQSGHDAFGAHYSSLADTRGTAMMRYGVQGLPTIIVVDAEGTIAFQQAGVPNENALRSAIDSAL